MVCSGKAPFFTAFCQNRADSALTKALRRLANLHLVKARNRIGRKDVEEFAGSACSAFTALSVIVQQGASTMLARQMVRAGIIEVILDLLVATPQLKSTFGPRLNSST